eukprot:CAMPEP_0117502830 /NCGR_PEP_ID=MMETSP0784-20121206/24013_1 /TAXON_ID=39447 /ORGANISM="" /LENGTH=353 /DNA_ID=CAMNT_0005298121 /DNA_START=116 /DNA_END=1175 /DNA_ORIENTATION=+
MTSAECVQGPPSQQQVRASEPPLRVREDEALMFNVRGECKRADACRFAHSVEELQSTPDLMRTKLCSSVNGGECPRGDLCTYAHSEAELRSIVAKNAQSAQANAEGDRCPSAQQEPKDELRHASLSDCGLAPDRQLSSRVRTAADAGALSLSEVTFHLAGIFAAFYESHPQVSQLPGVSLSALAAATARQIWDDAGLGQSARLAFVEVVRGVVLAPAATAAWTALAPALAAFVTGRLSELERSVGAKDVETCSQGSTEDGDSDGFALSAGYQTPPECEGHEAADSLMASIPTRLMASWPQRVAIAGDGRGAARPPWVLAGAEVIVQNTFIHVRPLDAAAGSGQRARSLPSRPD